MIPQYYYIKLNIRLHYSKQVLFLLKIITKFKLTIVVKVT